MLLTNGRVYTLDAAGAVVDSIVVRDGRVAFAGRRGEIRVPSSEPVIDLGGRAVLPGLVDAHAHLMSLATARFSVNVAHCGSETEAAGVVARAAANVMPGEWLTGRGWDQTRWPERAFPTRASLDAAAPRHPVALTRVDGHATWASTRALQAAGITRHTGDPPGGIVMKDTAGEPTGLLIDTAQDLVRAVQPRPSEERFEQAVREAIAECLARGLTGIHEMGASVEAIAAYTRLIERGHFPFRNYAAIGGKKAWARYRETGPETIGDGRLVIGALKLWLDGALGSRGAALHAPYCDDPGNTGLILIPPDEVERLTREASARGFQVCVHAIGDRANTLALDAFERVLATASLGDLRFRIEHAQVLAPTDIPRFGALGVLASMQPTHCTSDMRWAPERLGPERLQGAYAWRSLLATGAVIAAGSDFPVEEPNPFHGIHAAVTRRPPAGLDLGWQPEQRMTRLEAVRAFTTTNAYAARQETDLGSLGPGKRADLVVLSDDVFTCPEEQIKEIAPLMTMVAGEVVFRAARADGAG